MATAATRPVYRSKQWRLTRLRALGAAGWRCQRCGKAAVLEVHHRQRLADGGEPYDPDNLEVLCRPCHFRATGDSARHPVRTRLREFLQ